MHSAIPRTRRMVTIALALTVIVSVAVVNVGAANEARAAAIGVRELTIGGVDAANWNCAWAMGNGDNCVRFSGFRANGTKYWSQDLCSGGVNCTNYVAYRLSALGVADFVNGRCKVDSSARSWDERARECGVPVNSNISANSVLQFDSGARTITDSGHHGPYGHVAFIDYVSANMVYISEAQCGNNASVRYKIPLAELQTEIANSRGAIEVIHPKTAGQPPVTPQPGPFADVPSTHLFATAITWMQDKGVTQLPSTANFSPAANLTREQAVAFLYNLAGDPSVNLPASSPYGDVATTDPFYKPIMWARASGIVSSSSANFNPSGYVSRGTAAVMLMKFARESAPANCAQVFDDVPATHAYFSHICWLERNGLASGNGDLFRPGDGVTRAEWASLLYHVDTVLYTDVPMTSWYYPSVKWLYDEGITTVAHGTEWGLGDPVTRGALAVFMYKAAGSPAYTPPATSPYSDVPTTSSYYKPVMWLSENGVLEPGGAGNFGLNMPITRGALAVALAAYAQADLGVPCTADFTDIDAMDPAYSSACWMVSVDVASGGDTFDPGSNATRGHVAIYLFKLHEKGLLPS